MDIAIYHLRAGVAIGGGKAVYVRNMMAALSKRHDVTLYTGGGTILDRVRDLPVEVVQIPYGRTADRFRRAFGGVVHPSICNSLAMATTARRQGAFDRMDRHDCLWTHFWIDDILASRFATIPVVNHAHGYDWGGVGLGATLRKHLSRSRFCLANSATTARTLRDDLGVDPVGIVPPGVDLDHFSPTVDPAFEAENAAILFVGRLVERKGVFDLLDGYTSLREDTDADLYVVGSGGEERSLRRVAHERGIEDGVHLLGSVPIDELPRYYAAADVACHPSHWESFAIVNVEAMATGTPVVTTRLDAIEEYLTDGETGLLVPPGDHEALAAALGRLLDDDDLRQRFAAAGREVARSYSWDRQASAFVDVLREHLPRSTAPRIVRPAD